MRNRRDPVDFIVYLLLRPRSTWSAAEMLRAHQILTANEQVGLVAKVWIRELWAKMAEPQRSGRPEKITREFAARMLDRFEGVRQRIAEQDGCPVTRVQDKQVAEEIAFTASSLRNAATHRKRQRAREFANWVKYLKRKVKPRA